MKEYSDIQEAVYIDSTDDKSDSFVTPPPLN